MVYDLYMTYSPKHRVLSFKYAFEGLWQAFREQPNLKFHFLAAGVALLLGYIFQISSRDWLIVIFISGLVISLELTNSAIEEIVDYLIPQINPVAKKVKDIAAAAVLVASITAAIIGVIIFLPYLR